MDLYKAKLVTVVLAYGLVISGIIGAFLYYVSPSYFPQWFEGILVFFLAIESLIVCFVESVSRKTTQKQLLNTYLLTKVIKVFASLIFIGVYLAVVKEGIKSFVLTFMLFYLLYLIAETMIFVRIEKRLKKTKLE